MSINGITPSPGLNQSALLAAIKCADSIVLHAAIYTNFAHSEVGKLIRTKLIDGSLRRLDIIELQPNKYWQQEFLAILRPSTAKNEVISMLADSKDWSARLSTEFPLQVSQILTQALPLQPVLLIGDNLFVGHYAHSGLPSAQGLWLQLECTLLGLQPGDLQNWYQQGTPTEVASRWQQAISRYAEECRQAASLYLQAPSISEITKEENK